MVQRRHAHDRIEWDGGCYYFAPADPVAFRQAVAHYQARRVSDRVAVAPPPARPQLFTRGQRVAGLAVVVLLSASAMAGLVMVGLPEDLGVPALRWSVGALGVAGFLAVVVLEIVSPGRRLAARLAGLAAALVVPLAVGYLLFQLHLPPAPTTGPAGDPAPAQEPGWVALFNGKDLAGWKTHSQQPGAWRIDEAGHLVCTSGAAGSHLYYAARQFADFHLRVDGMINHPGDSGVCFRCQPDRLLDLKNALKKQPAGYEAQIRDVAVGMLIDLREGQEPVFLSEGLPVAADSWFRLEVIADGARLATRVNGQLVKEVTSGSHWSGLIAVQHAHAQTAVRFKKIEIKELPAHVPGAAVTP
jgi:hypothetical protein